MADKNIQQISPQIDIIIIPYQNNSHSTKNYYPDLCKYTNPKKIKSRMDTIYKMVNNKNSIDKNISNTKNLKIEYNYLLAKWLLYHPSRHLMFGNADIPLEIFKSTDNFISDKKSSLNDRKEQCIQASNFLKSVQQNVPLINKHLFVLD
jgi:hypothetical protein